jgi:hypothetical protein
LESIHDFSGPAMGRIVDVMIAPEDQPWFLKDVKLTVGTEDETNHREYDFAYNDIIGRRGGDLAACMKPMQRPTEEMKMQYDAEYIVLKDTMLVTTAELTAIGSLITACVSGIEKGYAFALGGSVGLIYIKLLQQGIDVVGQKGSIGSSVARLAIVSILVAAILSKYNEQIHSDHVLFVMGLVGFTMYRIAVLNTYINAKSPEIKEDKENMREK